MRYIYILLILMISIVSFSKDNKKLYVGGASEICSVKKTKGLLGQYEYKLPQNRIKIESSSYLRDKNYSYPAKNAIDGNIKSSWAEGVKGAGEGEWIKLILDLRGVKGATRELKILPGYGKSENQFKKNNRLKTFMLKSPDFVFDNRFTLKDKYAYHSLLITELYSGKIYTITLYIEEVYKGSKYDDTCIAEIIVVMANPAEGPDTSPL